MIDLYRILKRHFGVFAELAGLLFVMLFALYGRDLLTLGFWTTR